MAGSQRTAVLLGAGASADADLPLTRELASKIVALANEEKSPYGLHGTSDWVHALNAVYGGMINHQSAQGKNPLAAVNIETLISAVRLLSKREDHEVAPFVASWAPSLNSFNSRELPHHAGQAIANAIAGADHRRAFADRDIAKAVAEIARAALRPDLRKPFEDAERFVLRKLVDLLKAPSDVSYFEPLLELARTQEGGVDVITLNYDLTIETAAEMGGVAVQRGIDAWQPGETLTFSRTNNTINLMKLHGSLDWRRSRLEWGASKWITARSIDVIPPDVARGGESSLDLPWIVVGDREKLATDGPTLALNFAAREALNAATHLAVVGYAFGDFHINSLVRDWLQANSSRTVTILDHQWPREHYPSEPTDFRSALIDIYARPARHHARREQPPRVKLIEGPTKTHLRDALHTRPAKPPAILLSATAHDDDGRLRMNVTWHGDDLEEVRMGASITHDGQQEERVHIETQPLREDIAGLFGEVAFETWNLGETKSVYSVKPVALPVTLTLSGASLLGGVRHTTKVIAT